MYYVPVLQSPLASDLELDLRFTLVAGAGDGIGERSGGREEERDSTIVYSAMVDRKLEMHFRRIFLMVHSYNHNGQFMW